MRARLVRAFDRFVNVDGMCDAEAATTIHRDGVDILVDLMGYTTYARTGILVLRPAPVQVNYLGYPGTMGADFVDYLVADRIVVPTDDARYYSEKIVWMPHSYQVNDRARPIAGRQARVDLGLPEGAFVFCCFNQTYKILPVAFDVWMSLLKAVPGSVLWLLECSALAERNLFRETVARGIDPSRLIFAAKEPLARHLARLQAADLFLDTFPYNAHTTASDALWAGLPVITWAGNTFASRVAASLLNAVGLPELVCGSMDEYATLALRLATAPRELAALRDKLWRNRPTAPLFDTPAFTRDIEAAYRTMWQNYIEGNAPVEIRL
jgi:predicted O-linked N-acetylglucosamine transferase (SPINDLY family)